MTGRRCALIVASTAYADPGLSELQAPAADADALAEVLSDPDIGGFEVRTLLNEPAHVVNEAVEELLTGRAPEDLLLLHFSCHGIKDQSGELYFAMADTKLRLLGATAVAADFVNRRMAQSRSHRIVLFLDCCYAGAFDRGMRTRGTQAMDLEERFSGRGRAVITASGAVEYAFEGGELTRAGHPAPSVFTSAMVRGLSTGEADQGQDGYVDLDELYDYVYAAVREVTPHQTPGKWVFGIEGELVLARRSNPVAEPAPLPRDLVESLESPIAGVRAGVVGELVRLMEGRHLGLAVAARRTLEQLADDDSRAVSSAATAALAERAVTPQSPPPPDAPPPGSGADPPRRRSLRPRRPRRSWVAVAAAAVLLVAGTVVWLLVGRTETSTVIPASFDGKWVGEGSTGDTSEAGFTALLGAGLSTGQLQSGNSSCYGGSLKVVEATDSELTMRFSPGEPDCNPWTVVFTHAAGPDDALVMSVDPDSSSDYEQEFQVDLARQG